MAKYDITYACGHTETVQIYGTNVHGEREKKAAWLAEHHVCFACLKANREAAKAAAAERAKANGMTEGSDKQMAWACDILEQAIAELEAYKVGQAFAARHADKVPALRAKGAEAARALVAEAIEEQAAKVWTLHAKYIIDNRYGMVALMANAAADSVAKAL